MKIAIVTGASSGLGKAILAPGTILKFIKRVHPDG